MQQRLDPAALARPVTQRLERRLDRAAALVAEDDEERRVQVDPAYCMVPATSGDRTLPATRTTNSSPKPASNTSSGGTRESLQPRIVA